MEFQELSSKKSISFQAKKMKFICKVIMQQIAQFSFDIPVYTLCTIQHAMLSIAFNFNFNFDTNCYLNRKCPVIAGKKIL